VLPLEKRHDPGDDSQRQKESKRDDEHAQSPVAATRRLDRAELRLSAGDQEVAFELIQLGIVRRRPLARAREAQASVEHRAVAAKRSPFARSLGEPAMDQPAFAIFGQPGA
jgi:hypothetical protein